MSKKESKIIEERLKVLNLDDSTLGEALDMYFHLTGLYALICNQ